MAGQGHQFPGNFQGNATGMRSGFGGGPMGNQMQPMPNQMAGVMGPMGNPGGMVGMGNPMVPPYATAMQNQMGNMGMGPQGMGVVSGAPGGSLAPPQVPQPDKADKLLLVSPTLKDKEAEERRGKPNLKSAGSGEKTHFEQEYSQLQQSVDNGFSRTKKRRLKRNRKQGVAILDGRSKAKRGMKQDMEDEKSQQWPEKRKLASTSSERPRASAREQGDLALMIYRSDGIHMDEVYAKAVRRKLSGLIGAAARQEINGRNLSFAASGLVSEGYFLVTPDLPQAMEWLLRQDLGEVDGFSLAIRKLGRPRVSVWIPGDKDDHPEDIMLYLRAQNNYREDLKIKEWVLISRETFHYGEKLLMDVPQDVFGDHRDQVWLYFEVTKVLAKLIDRNRQGADRREGGQDERATDDTFTTDAETPPLTSIDTTSLLLLSTPPGVNAAKRPCSRNDERLEKRTKTTHVSGTERGSGKSDCRNPAGDRLQDATKDTALPLLDNYLGLEARAGNSADPVNVKKPCSPTTLLQ